MKAKMHTPRAPRTRVLLDAIVQNRASEQKVRIRDFTVAGARIDGESPGMGATVCLIRGSETIEARVMWEKAGSFGVRFKKPMQNTDLFKPIAHKIDLPIHADALTRGVGTTHKRPCLRPNIAAPQKRGLMFGRRNNP